MADQVSPLGNLGTGTAVVALPVAKPQTHPEGPASARSNPPEASPVRAGAGRAAKAPEVNPQTIDAQLKQANSALEFKVDRSTGISYFKIVDATTGKVIRQVPSADVLAMAQKLHDFSNQKDPAGILMDQKG